MKNIGILFHPLNESACTLAEELGHLLSDKGFSVWLCSAWDETIAKQQADGTELILSVGGDGTILRAAQVALSGRIPITGINMGKLGFMTEIKADESRTKIFDMVNGDGWLDERTMLEVSLPGQDKPAYHALNDIVLARGSVVRIVSIETILDGESFTTYRADGVILSTATGSTGYSLAAGGPILHPSSGDFILLPILPHLSPAHSLVLPAATGVRLVIKTSFTATLSIDGHTNLDVTDGTSIAIKRSPYTTRFLRAHPRNSFYNTLEQKLKGKQTR